MYQPSYWDKITFFDNLDVIVIGSGIVGLTAAIQLSSLHPSLKILVLEQGPLPYGASNRNAGFACFGSISEIMDDLSKESPDSVYKRIEKRFRGIEELRKLLGDEAIGYQRSGGWELFTTDDVESYESCLNRMDGLNKDLSEIFGGDAFKPDDKKIVEFGFGNTAHMIYNPFEGQVDTSRMMQSLESMARSKGIMLLNGITVKNVDRKSEYTLLETSQGWTFSCKACLIAVNGFAKNLISTSEVQPARSQVLVTNPITELKVRGTFHYNKGYTYFRNIGDRILVGGGRNLAMEEENTNAFGTTDIIQQHLENMLQQVIIPSKSYTIHSRWSGIMGLGTSKNPEVKKLQQGVFCAVGLGGMGVAIGTDTGYQAAELVSNELYK